MPDIVAELPRMLIESCKAELYATGAVPRPQVHMFAEDVARQYIGIVMCRPFYQGEDTITAIGDLGVLPSVMKMTRLMVLWENRDLTTALQQRQSMSPLALMLLDAQLDQHTLHRYAFDTVPTGNVVDGVPTIRLEWTEPTQQDGPPLPQPLHKLLRTWRELRGGDIESTVTALEQSGYEFGWTKKT